jgi:hypothetical protein
MQISASQQQQNPYPGCCTKTGLATAGAATVGAFLGGAYGTAKTPYVIASHVIDQAVDKKALNQLTGEEKIAAKTLIAHLKTASTVEVINKFLPSLKTKELTEVWQKSSMQILNKLPEKYRTPQGLLSEAGNKLGNMVLKRNLIDLEKAREFASRTAIAAPLKHAAAGAFIAGLSVVGLHALASSKKPSVDEY